MGKIEENENAVYKIKAWFHQKHILGDGVRKRENVPKKKEKLKNREKCIQFHEPPQTLNPLSQHLWMYTMYVQGNVIQFYFFGNYLRQRKM